jgi:hypothetical protein
MPPRELPDAPHPFPHVIAGHHLMAALRIPAREGECPNLAIMIGRDPSRPADRMYVVWDAAVRGADWYVYSSFNDLSWDAAVEEFTTRTSRAFIREG